jgi:hypothetical protein
MGRDGEPQPDIHPARIALHRRIQELLKLGEGDDFVEAAVHFGTGHPGDRSVEVDVLPPGQLPVKPRPDLEQRGDFPVKFGGSLSRVGDP